MIKYPHRYPSLDSYAHTMSVIYSSKYPNIPSNALRALLIEIVKAIKFCIDEDSPSFTLLKISWARWAIALNGRPLTEAEIDRQYQIARNIIKIHAYSTKSELTIGRALEAHDLRYPKSEKIQQELGDCAREAVIQFVKEIGTATEKAIKKLENRQSKSIDKAGTHPKKDSAIEENVGQYDKQVNSFLI